MPQSTLIHSLELLDSPTSSLFFRASDWKEEEQMTSEQGR